MVRDRPVKHTPPEGFVLCTRNPRYCVNSLGTVLNLSDLVLRPRDSKPNKYGYLIVSLHDGHGSYRKTGVHRLVAEAFIPNADSELVVNHINGNKADNTVNNLEWLSRADNVRHAFSTGLMPTSVRLTPEQREHILDLSTGLGCRKLAEIYKLDRKTIKKIRKEGIINASDNSNRAPSLSK